MALMCVPWAIQLPLSTGSRLVVAVMMMSLSSAAIFGPVDRDHLGLAHLAHLRGETAAAFLVGTVDHDAAHLAHLADGQQLRAGLLAAAEEADLGGVGPGHVLRGHAAGRPGAHLAEIVGLHQGQQARRSCRRRAGHGTGRRLAAGGVDLGPHDAERLDGRRHGVQHGVVGLRAARGTFCASSRAILRSPCSTASRAMSIVSRRRTSSSFNSSVGMGVLPEQRISIMLICIACNRILSLNPGEESLQSQIKLRFITWRRLRTAAHGLSLQPLFQSIQPARSAVRGWWRRTAARSLPRRTPSRARR